MERMSDARLDSIANVGKDFTSIPYSTHAAYELYYALRAEREYAKEQEAIADDATIRVARLTARYERLLAAAKAFVVWYDAPADFEPLVALRAAIEEAEEQHD